MTLVSGLGSTRAADSTCLPFPLPYGIRLTYSPQPDANSAVGCGAPIPCTQASPPTVEEWPEALTQELRLTATPQGPIGGYAHLVIWQQEWNESNTGLTPGITIETSDVIERAVAAGTNAAEYRLTGLKTGAKYQHRVAWCRLTGTVKTCNCFQDAGVFIDSDTNGIPDARPSTFPTPPLALPSGVVERAEDQFRAPSTDPKRNRVTNALEGGDGLGPTAWKDDLGAGAVNVGNGAHIALDSNGNAFAEIPWDSFLEWQVSEAPPDETDTVAEVEFRPHSTGAKPNPTSGSVCGSVTCNYRVSAVSRLVKSGGLPFYYNAQVHYDPDWTGAGAAVASVRIQRGTGTQRPDLMSWPVAGTSARDPNTGLGCVIDGSDLAADQSNTAGLRDDSRKLVRVRVKDNSSSQPEIFATVAWGWNGSTYSRQCTYKHTDTTINPQHPLYKAEGGWAFIVQHFDARLESFRGFSAP